MTLDNILEEIKKANKIVILTHENPDGDAIGSSLGLSLALKQLDKNVDVIIPEFPKIFDFLPDTENIKKESDEEVYDLAIALDCSDIQRLNGFAKYFEDAKVKIVIDHHGKNKMFGDYNYVDPVAPACAQILIAMLEYFNIDITKEIGTCLIAGIITDTGGFRYSGVTTETFEFASWILSKGINISEIYRKVLQTKTKTNFELTKLAMERMEFLENEKISYTYITKEDEERIGTQHGDHEGLVEIGRDIEGVEVSIFIREAEKGYKVSLRSNEYVDVADVCFMFGGGGHLRAAGCTINGTLEQVKQKILTELKARI